MSDKITKSPQIRFAGFTDAWEQRKVGEFYNFKNGLNKEKEYFGRGIPIVNFTDVFHNRGLYANELNGKVDLSDKEITNFEVKQGDIFFTRTSETINEIGYPSVMLDVPINTVFSGFVLRGRAIAEDPLDNNFKRYVFFTNQFREEMKKKSSMTTRALTSGTAIKEMYFKFPNSKKEQAKIGALFAYLDHLFTLHQRKLELLIETRKSLLQRIFPKDGADVPEIRFAGFIDAWEQLTVSELANRYDNLRVPITASERVAGSTPYYGANGIQDYVEGFTHDGEFILVAEDGASDLENYPVQYVNGKVWVNNHAHVLQAKPEIADNKFLMNAMKHTNIKPYLVGGGRAKLNADVMMKISFRVPELAEQKQIGSFFSNLDHLITLHKRELNSLENLKKSLLQQMFI
ncbi:restriction endonuclease subunit S [Cytobacillus horneckiae]|uniref:restriction endonuclease subunit S n=1 Tax=Cytobacillus horneckiae TaxID=549687 RepID=UPI002DBEDE8D|nr:restriction endonuclease subunit S [Cytobacillus horneckiae]MEC1158104.1 restriction endonuclease subunit S [Cytobacillus horneckiae]MED2936375.1 restriction endonuclease subunit S [Cytobacillus horneckiae]